MHIFDGGNATMKLQPHFRLPCFVLPTLPTRAIQGKTMPVQGISSLGEETVKKVALVLMC